MSTTLKQSHIAILRSLKPAYDRKLYPSHAAFEAELRLIDELEATNLISIPANGRHREKHSGRRTVDMVFGCVITDLGRRALAHWEASGL